MSKTKVYWITTTLENGCTFTFEHNEKWDGLLENYKKQKGLYNKRD